MTKDGVTEQHGFPVVEVADGACEGRAAGEDVHHCYHDVDCSWEVLAAILEEP